MPTSIAVFTRDLRVRDNPMLAAAAQSSRYVVPLFVHDTSLASSAIAAPAKTTFLAECLTDLAKSLRAAGAGLVERHGDLVTEVVRVVRDTGAHEVHMASDVSHYARDRRQRLEQALAQQRCAVRIHPEVHTVVEPGRLRPSGGNDHFAVFTPYYRRWADCELRDRLSTPRQLRFPPGQKASPAHRDHHDHPCKGGETQAQHRADRWFSGPVDDYAGHSDMVAEDATSRLSPYLHFGCVSPRDLVERAHAQDTEGARAFLRQLAWRDFHHQVFAARPQTATQDYRPRGDRWRDDEQALEAWRAGQTGIPIVDAGMRQLAAENWMHNRARLITGSFLTKSLYLDWRHGARHFFEQLLDGDLANNCGNWQWVAGTGNDTRPNRVLNPVRQALRYDPDGRYVRTWVPELADLEQPRQIHQPWTLGDTKLRGLGYPAPITDLDAAGTDFLRAREAN